VVDAAQLGGGHRLSSPRLTISLAQFCTGES
jgi:hypothetical protein